MIKMNIKFSVLIPAFKKSYLNECIDSVLKQTYTNFELIIVNDASPEDLDSLVRAYADARIKYYVNQKNVGAYDVVKNWNLCLSHATGDYVICMGDDDCLKPNCLEVYNEIILANPGIGILHGWTEIIDANSEIRQMTTHRCNKESAMSLLWHRIFAYHAQFIGDFCFKRSSLINNGGFFFLPLAWGSDEISSIIAAGENGIINTQEVVFQYRRTTQTITQSGDITIKIAAFNEKVEWLNNFISGPREDRIDELYRKDLSATLPHYAEKQRSFYVISDLRLHSCFRIFFWIKNRKRFRIRMITIFYAAIRSFIHS